ncbi:MAG TPA: septum formation initiator family protein [Syntrophales bacterium]|nr:septum formation initiator family protein [Syntrophales bacterium]
MKVGRYLLLFVVFMALIISFGNRGLVDNYKMREKLQTLERTNENISNANGELKRTIMLLRSDPATIERIARDELGMVKPGDFVYRFGK